MAITFPTPADLTTRLDELEARLPVVSARVLKLQRAVAAATYDRTVAAFEAIASSINAFLATAKTSGKTVTGQAPIAQPAEARHSNCRQCGFDSHSGHRGQRRRLSRRA